ncbi:glycosyl transferase family 1 [Planctomycetales bacterium]|nr:glycosyl transferase family 1 [Planctomycetales bacterium]
MKIALCAWEAVYAIEIGGVSAHVFGLAAALAAAGHETHLFTRQGDGQNATDLINGVYYHRCPWRANGDLFSEVAAFAETTHFYLQNTAALINGFDVLHCHDWLTFALGARWQKEQGGKFIATFHTTEWGRSGAWPERGDGLKIAETELAATRDADGVIVVSQEISRQVKLLYHCPDWKTRLIHYGIDCLPPARHALLRQATRAKYQLPENAPVCLFVGSLSERKGADILIEKLPEILPQVAGGKFIFAGHGSLLGRLREIIDHNAATETVLTLTDYAAGELAALYYAADVVAIPYRYDPFGAVALAAWEAARPVAVCGDGATAELVFNEVNGIKTTPENFGAALVNLLNHPEHGKWLGMNGRAAAETAFSWQTIAERVLALYKNKVES